MPFPEHLLTGVFFFLLPTLEIMSTVYPTSREIQRTLMELLNQLDGFEDLGQVKMVMATNRPGKQKSDGTKPLSWLLEAVIFCSRRSFLSLRAIYSRG